MNHRNLIAQMVRLGIVVEINEEEGYVDIFTEGVNKYTEPQPGIMLFLAQTDNRVVGARLRVKANARYRKKPRKDDP